MPIAGLMTGTGAYEGLKELLARQMLERQQSERERSALIQEGLEGRQLDESAAFRQLQQQGLEQERQRDETYRRDALGQQRQMSAAQLARAQAADAATQQRHVDTMDLRRDLAAQSNRRIVSLANARRAPKIHPDYFTWIQSLPTTDKDMQVGVQKALKFAPQGNDPQEIVRAVREAYGMTARPTQADAPGALSEAERLLINEMLNGLDADLDDGVIDRATYDQRRQAILAELQ